MAIQNYHQRTEQRQDTQLLTYNSDLRTLRYGSQEPLITTDIPDPGEELSNLPVGDFLLRGGILQPTRLLTDTVRLTKYFASVDGLLFTAKQNVLAQGPAIERAVSNFLTGRGQILPKNREGVYLPTSTVLQASLGANNGIHLNKQGINPFAPTNGDGGRGASQGNQSGVLEFLNSVIGFAGRPFYLGENVVGGEDGSENRLVQLTLTNIGEYDLSSGEYSSGEDLFGGSNNPYTDGTKVDFNSGRKTKTGEYTTDKITAFTAWGNNTDQQELVNSTLFENDFRVQYNENGTFTPPAHVTSSLGEVTNRFYVGRGVSEIADERYNTDIVSELEETNLTSSADNHLDPNSTDRQNLNTLSEVPQPSDFFLDFRRINNENHIGPDYNDKNIEDRVMNGNPGGEGDRSDYQKGKILPGNTSTTPADKVNWSAIYRSGTGPSATKIQEEVNDLVKFRIAAVDSDNPSNSFYMHFRSYIDSFQDNYNAEWNAQRFMGRGENFYKYQGFDRDIAMSFTVAAQSKPELMRMYHKLNYLATNVMPDFTSGGYMSGPLLRLTVGGYLYEQYGFLQSLNYQIPQESPWEIAIPSSGVDAENNVVPFADPTVKEMPHIIQVTGFQFKPIHSFVPRKNRVRASANGDVETFGRERPIALSNGFAHADGYRASNYNDY